MPLLVLIWRVLYKDSSVNFLVLFVNYSYASVYDGNVRQRNFYVSAEIFVNTTKIASYLLIFMTSLSPSLPPFDNNFIHNDGKVGGRKTW